MKIEPWIEQANEQGKIFFDSYLHPECKYIHHWKSREVWSKEFKEIRQWCAVTQSFVKGNH